MKLLDLGFNEDVVDLLYEIRGSRGVEDGRWKVEDEEETSRGINGKRSYKGGEELQRSRIASKGERGYKEPLNGREVSKES